jgi:uncharacterized membrane protein
MALMDVIRLDVVMLAVALLLCLVVIANARRLTDDEPDDELIENWTWPSR